MAWELRKTEERGREREHTTASATPTTSPLPGVLSCWEKGFIYKILELRRLKEYFSAEVTRTANGIETPQRSRERNTMHATTAAHCHYP